MQPYPTTPAAPSDFNPNKQFPCFAEFRKQVYELTDIDQINQLILRLAAAKRAMSRELPTHVHAFTVDESKHAWNLLQKRARTLFAPSGGYPMGDWTWRLPINRKTPERP